MKNKITFFIQTAKNKVIAVLPKIKFVRIRSLTEFAEHAGLAVVELAHRPKDYAGYLDWNDEPRFIAVNRDLPIDEKAWFIAQKVAVCAQQRRVNSLVLDCPWKWELLRHAPVELKEKILTLDQEARADGFMLLFANTAEFKPYAKKHGSFRNIFTSNVVAYHLYKLRIKIKLNKIGQKLFLVGSPVS